MFCRVLSYLMVLWKNAVNLCWRVKWQGIVLSIRISVCLMNEYLKTKRNKLVVDWRNTNWNGVGCVWFWIWMHWRNWCAQTCHVSNMNYNGMAVKAPIYGWQWKTYSSTDSQKKLRRFVNVCIYDECAFWMYKFLNAIIFITAIAFC